MITNDLIIGFIAGVVWVFIGFYVCVTVADRWRKFKAWADVSVVFSLWLIFFWPVVGFAYGVHLLIKGKCRIKREAL